MNMNRRVKIVVFIMGVAMAATGLSLIKDDCYAYHCRSFTKGKATVDDLDCTVYPDNWLCKSYNCAECISLESHTYCYVREYGPTCRTMPPAAIVLYAVGAIAIIYAAAEFKCNSPSTQQASASDPEAAVPPSNAQTYVMMQHVEHHEDEVEMDPTDSNGSKVNVSDQ